MELSSIALKQLPFDALRRGRIKRAMSACGTSRACDDANGTSAVEARTDMWGVFVRASRGGLCVGNGKTYCASPLSEGALYSCANRNHCERIGAPCRAVLAGLWMVAVGSKTRPWANAADSNGGIPLGR